VGDRAPDFALALTDGSTVTSESLAAAGKPMFLFFMATW
jgi:peroxiredoxin